MPYDYVPRGGFGLWSWVCVGVCVGVGECVYLCVGGGGGCVWVVGDLEHPRFTISIRALSSMMGSKSQLFFIESGHYINTCLEIGPFILLFTTVYKQMYT